MTEPTTERDSRRADRPRPLEGLRTRPSTRSIEGAGKPPRCRGHRGEPSRAQGRLDRRGPRRLVRRQARRGLRRHGPVRQRQVDARPLPDPADRADGRARSMLDGEDIRKAEPGAAPRAAPAPLRDGLPALRPAAPSAGPRQRRVRAGDPRRAEGRPPGAGARDARPRRPRRAWPTATRTSCPAASSSASGWPGRSPSTRRSCSSTSRSAPSTR